MARILIVDDEDALRTLMGRQLRRAGHDVTFAEDGLVACELLSRESFEVVLSDMRMPRVGGMELLAKAREIVPDIEFIILTGHGSMENAVQAFKTGNVFDYMLKPLEDIYELDAVIARAVERYNLRRENARLSVEATSDGLTGLKNHRALHERLSEEVERSRRYKSPLSLAMIDVDRFKEYNDSFGHPAGDEVLRKLSAALRDSIRGCDVAARYGGEEFAVILPESDEEAAKVAAERIRSAIAGVEWPHRPVTVSVGVATWADPLTTPCDLLAEADRALYRSKQRGRNRVTHARFDDDAWVFARSEEDWYTRILNDLLAAQGENLALTAQAIRSMLAEGYDKTVESWAKLLAFRDKETEGHTERVTNMTVRLAHFIGMNEEEALYARWGAMLHDIGKVAVPDSILQKPGPLTDEEWEVMRRHPGTAYDILMPIPFLRSSLDIPYCHHEKWDGTGYPRGLKGNDIPLPARIFAVIDVWDALSSDRPYRKAWDYERIRSYLIEESGKHFDRRAVRAFLAMLDATETPSANVSWSEADRLEVCGAPT